MTFKDIVGKFKVLKVYEVRKISDHYYECVIYNKDIDTWMDTATKCLGLPIKSAGAKPSMKEMGLCQKYGSILVEQTLFKKMYNDVEMITMFWPWKDNVHTTVKMWVS